MTKFFSPKNLRLVLNTLFLLISLGFLAQNTVYLDVNWPRYSGENKMEIINSSGTVVLSIIDTYTNNSNTNFSGNSNNINLPNGDYTVKVYDRYGDDWNGTGPYGRVFVNGSQAFNFDGNFTNNASSAYTEINLEFSLTIGTIDDASFSYSQTGYCQTLSDPTPIITGETGGTFSSTPGLSINSSTGQIDLSASTLGNYVVTYTTTAPDQNSSTQNVSITDGDFATFSYAIPFVTQNENDITPTVTGQSGIFSSTSGLSINSSNGTIDVSASTPGLYTVSYTTNGSCPKTYTDSVQIIASTYYNNSKKYIEYIPGTMPVIISAPHGGTLTGNELATRGCGTGEMDDNTDILIREIQKKCFEQFGVYPYIIINNLRRNKLDPNRTESIATCGNTAAKPYFDAYHNFIDQASADVTTKFGKGLYIDLHGQSHSIPRIEAGYNLPSSSFDENLNNTATNAVELARVTIKNLIDNNIQNLTFEDLIRGSQSFGGLMQTTGGTEYAALGHAGCSRGVGYRTVPSHVKTGSDQGSCDDTNPGSNSYFAGDYYSNIRHGSGDTSYANSVVGGGGSVNGGGGTIDGIMTEVNRRVRDLGSSYSSIYGRSDSRSPTVPYFSRDYAKVIKDFIEKHYNDFSNFSYNTAIHSIYGLDPSPSISGISGGIFSSSSGLSINASTGVIDVSDSSPGSYVVTYTAPNVGEFYSKEFTITINSDPVTNTFTSNSGNWSDLSNWSLIRIPLVTDNVSIPSASTVNLDLSNVLVNDISVLGTLTINSGKSLTVTGNLTNTGTIAIHSDATTSGSLIVQGNATGNIIYNRYIKDNSNWYMISSPVENQDIDSFVAINPIVIGSGNNVGLSNYNNSTSTWEYYQNGTTNSGDFDLGDGRAVKRTTPGSLVFTGTLKTGDVSKPVILGTDGWNLIGNPYPSLLNVNTNANSSNNMVSVNFANLSAGFKALYFWDAVNGSYVPFNNASDAKYIAPGQGFFVKIDGNTNISFNENMQTHQLGDNFLRSQNTFNIKLKVNDGKSVKKTDIKYINKMTLGIDEGYDARLFDEKTPFSISTYILDESDNYKYAIQVLPTYNYDSMVVPISVNAKSNTELVFTIEANNIPSGFNLYLEDRELNTFTKLDELDSSYKVSIANKMNGEKRFYLHTTSEVLSAENVTYDSSIRIYQNTQNTLKIEGLKKENAKIKLISILGKEVFKEALKNTLNQEVKVNNISKGIYIVQISFASGKITKKVIFD